MHAVLQSTRLVAVAASALLAASLGAATLSSCDSAPISTEDTQPLSVADRGITASDGDQTPIKSTGREAAYEVFRRAAESCLTTVEIGRGLAITQEDLTAAVEELRFTPEYLCATGDFSFEMYAPTEDDDYYACTLYLGYDHDVSLVPQYRAQLQATANDVVARIVTPDMTDYDKALALHDYLIENCKYDTSLTRYSTYDALVGHCATCLGYCQAYKMLLDLVGIENEYVTSKSMEHRWSMVKIDGAWYHVDVTWDDPIVDGSGELDAPVYDNFLKSDESMTETGHYEWTAEHSAPSDYAA